MVMVATRMPQHGSNQYANKYDYWKTSATEYTSHHDLFLWKTSINVMQRAKLFDFMDIAIQWNEIFQLYLQDFFMKIYNKQIFFCIHLWRADDRKII